MMKKKFLFNLEGDERECSAEIEYQPNTFLKVKIDVFKNEEVDFRVAIYTNPSFTDFFDLAKKDEEALIGLAIQRFKNKGAPNQLSEIRESGIRVIYNWSDNA